VHIDDGAIIGAGTVVTKNVPPYAIVAGNPARVIKYRYDADVIKKLLTIKWWLWDENKIREALPYFYNGVEEFINRYSV
jgi:virginiamycin A acetyltransferase